ncbi:MAG: stage IV sporulation protein A, partial [Eubacterium sp.]
VMDFSVDESSYYDTLSEITGSKIENQLHLIRFVKELAAKKTGYDKVNSAITKVKETGYGIVMPDKEEIVLDSPELIKNGSNYGVKIKATAPSIHFVKANILTEISPIIGNEEQAKDLIEFINANEEHDDIWDTNIFGKTIGQIVEEGISNKIDNLTEDTRARMQGTVEKITNDQSKGVICILL